MPRYHFNLHDADGPLADEDGRDLADDTAARAEAVRGIRSMLAAQVLDGYLDLDGHLEVADTAGALFFTIAFADAVEIRQPPGDDIPNLNPVTGPPLT